MLFGVLIAMFLMLKIKIKSLKRLDFFMWMTPN